MKIHRMFVYIRSAAFIIVVTPKLVLQQSKYVTAKCTETLLPPPCIQFSLSSPNLTLTVEWSEPVQNKLYIWSEPVQNKLYIWSEPVQNKLYMHLAVPFSLAYPVWNRPASTFFCKKCSLTTKMLRNKKIKLTIIFPLSHLRYHKKLDLIELTVLTFGVLDTHKQTPRHARI